MATLEGGAIEPRHTVAIRAIWRVIYPYKAPEGKKLLVGAEIRCTPALTETTALGR